TRCLHPFPTRRSSDLLPPQSGGLVDDDDESWRLDEFPRRRSRIDPGHTCGKTLRSRVLFRMRTAFALIEQRFGPSLERDFLGLRSEEHTSELQSRVDL